MNDDNMMSASDLEELKRLCVTYKLVRCDLCYHCLPQAGYDVPHCDKLSEKFLNINYSKPYRLVLVNIPASCIYFLDAEQENNRRELKYAVDELNLAKEKVERLTGKVKKK